MALSSSITPVDERALQDLLDQLQAVCGQDVPFLNILIQAQVRVLGGGVGTIFVTEGKRQPRVVAVWPSESPDRISIEPQRMGLLRDCVKRCRRSATQQAYRVGEGERIWHAVCTPLIRLSQVQGVCVVLTDPDDEPSVQVHMAQVRWFAQLYPGHVAQRMLTRHAQEATETQIALAVLGAVQEAGRFQICCMNLVNQLKAQLGARRISMAWAYGNNVHLVAVSDTENLDQRQALSQKLQAALEECFDQAQPVVAPVDRLENDDQWLAQAVARCHHELTTLGEPVTVCSVPLRLREQVLGAVTVEMPADPDSPSFSGRCISHLQAVADLTTPRLADCYVLDRPMSVQAWGKVRSAVGTIIGPRNVALKLIALAIFGLLMYACVARWEYRITSPFSFKARDMRFYSAYFDTTIEQVFVEKGELVARGQRLARLDEQQIVIDIQREEALKAAEQTNRRLATADRKTAEAQRAEARIRQHDAELARLRYLKSLAVIHAQEAGVVLEGQWKQRLGERVEKNKPLFTVAPIEKLWAVVYVDESEIDRVHEGAKGELAARAHPEQLYGFTVARVIPLGEPMRGRNVFEVYGELDQRASWMFPGMEGTAKINAGQQAVIWIATHKLVEFLRLKLWM